MPHLSPLYWLFMYFTMMFLFYWNMSNINFLNKYKMKKKKKSNNIIIKYKMWNW